MHFACRSRRRPAIALAAATCAAALLGAASAVAAHNVNEPISVAPDGTMGNGSSVSRVLGDYGDMTPNGARRVRLRCVEAVPGDTNRVGDVFVATVTGATERVSVGPRGVQGNGDSNFLGISTAPAISDDGRYVAFKSDASNLVKGDRNNLTDVFVRDRGAGATERISGDGGGDNPDISPDGNFVAFETFGFDGDFAQDIYLRNRTTGAIERISVSFDGSEIFSPSEDPVVANGPVVAFASGAPNLVPNDGSNIDVFVRDLSGPTPTTELVSVSSDEQPAGEFDTSRNPAITGDGRFVAFQSDAQNFTAAPQTGFFSDIFVRDRQNGTTVLASPSGDRAGRPPGRARTRRSARTAATSRSRRSPRISSRVRRTPTATRPDPFVRDLKAGTTELVSVKSAHRTPRVTATTTTSGRAR